MSTCCGVSDNVKSDILFLFHVYNRTRNRHRLYRVYVPLTHNMSVRLLSHSTTRPRLDVEGAGRCCSLWRRDIWPGQAKVHFSFQFVFVNIFLLCPCHDAPARLTHMTFPMIQGGRLCIARRSIIYVYPLYRSFEMLSFVPPNKNNIIRGNTN